MGDYEDRYPEAYGRGETTPVPETLRDTAPRQVRDAPLAGAITTPADPAGATVARDVSHRGRGPRGYVRSAERIREDLCDRLSYDPFVDASEIDVVVHGTEVTLAGVVDSTTAYQQALEIAQEVPGITRIHDNLRVGNSREAGATPGTAVNAAMGVPNRRL